MKVCIVAASLLALVACTFDPSAQIGGNPGVPVDADLTRPDADPSAPDADLTLPDADPSKPDANPSFDAALGVADAGAPDAKSCPTDYIENANGSCYRTVSSTATWTVAEADCEDDASGAHLIVIDSASEDAMVANFHWIGYTERVSDGEFLWVNGSLGEYPGFASGEPVSGGAACVVTRSDGWHDDNCGESKVYVCEYDGMPAIAITY